MYLFKNKNLHTIRCIAVIIMKENNLSNPTNPVISMVWAIEAMVSLLNMGLWVFMSYHVEVVDKYTADLK